MLTVAFCVVSRVTGRFGVFNAVLGPQGRHVAPVTVKYGGVEESFVVHTG